MIYNTYADQKAEVSGIQLVSCGHIFAKPGREINRPNGRKDWLLFYIAKESETFYLDSLTTGRAGSFVIFAPDEKQHHVYTGSKTAEFYFVHFNCNTLPDGISLSTSKVYDSVFSQKVCGIFEDIIDETLRKQPLYEKLCIYKLLQLFALLERSVNSVQGGTNEGFERIACAVQHMNKSYNDNCSLEDYAAMCAMSKFHFIRVFENVVGVTPLAYRNNIRLQHAADLLLEERLTVEEIGSLTGFSCASYFSSAFKQKYGLSPKQYQKLGCFPQPKALI